MKTKIRIYLSILVIAAILVLPTLAQAASRSPFVGHWQAIDTDGSDLGLTIAGKPNGPFKITWTENYISFCNGDPGIVRGTGWLNEGDPYLLEADLHLKCFKTGASLDFHLAFRYHPATNTLSNRYEFGVVTIWHRPGQTQPAPPALNLRVNYGHDWVESFYEAGHMAWITVTESDGVTLKAMAELVTEPKDFWGGETGFQTRSEDWDPAPPDIQPYDWVYGWVDNGASAQVQLGEISGMIDLETDSIEGTILAPWFSSQVDVECHPWGALEPTEMKFDTILPDGNDPYACSWAGEWDIQAGQDVGVGYTGPDGHWVTNAFFIPTPPSPYIWADSVSEFINGWNWPEGNNVTLNLYDPADVPVYSAEQVAGPDSGVGFDVLGVGIDIQAGFKVILSDGFTTKELIVSSLQITAIDPGTRTVSGIYDPNPNLGFWINLAGQEPESLIFEDGQWFATFTEFIPGQWGEVAQPDEDGDMTGFSFFIP